MRTTLATLAIAALAVAGLTACSPDPAPTPSPSPSAVVTPTPTPSPSQTPSATPTATPTVARAVIVLSAAGIGDVPMGTVNPVPALVKLLGPANGSGIPTEHPCSAGTSSRLAWPDLNVNFDTSAGVKLWGWDLFGPKAPVGVTTKSGVVPGAPLSAATALPGATAPSYVANADATFVEADGVTYLSEGSDPANSTITRVTVNQIMCD